jgi:hypothetical protein
METNIICPNCNTDQNSFKCEINCTYCNTYYCLVCHEPFYIENFNIIRGHMKDCYIMNINNLKSKL